MSCLFFQNKKQSRKITINEASDLSKKHELPLPETRLFSQLYTSNYIRTTKYTVFTFFPKTLFFQFKRPANLYFLMTSIVQSIPLMSSINPFSAIVPLIIILSVSLIRELLESLVRYKSDLETNSKIALTLNNGKIQQTKWKNLKVGDIIFLQNNELVSADALVLATSHENASVFIETSSLDGERNLKTKMAIKETCAGIQVLSDIQKKKQSLESIKIDSLFQSVVTCGPPDMSFYVFNGTMQMYEEGRPMPLQINLSTNNFLMRGCSIKNTAWVFALVLYTGNDTKIMKNSEKGKIKQSKMDKSLQKYIVFILLIQTSLALTVTLLSYFWKINHQQLYIDIIPYESIASQRGIVQYFRFFLLLNTMLPISLIVSLEIMKVILSRFVQADEEMKKVDSNRFVRVFTSSIIEELGQVDFIFTDKTGTLTCNKMELKSLIIGNLMYGCSLEYDEASKKFKLIHNNDHIKPLDSLFNFSFYDQKLVKLIYNEELNYDLDSPITFGTTKENYFELATQKEVCHEFFLLLSICHECIRDKSIQDNNNPFQGASPDEITLVHAASWLGYVFVDRHPQFITLNILGKDERIEIKKIFEFDAERKCQSVIILHNGIYKFYIKGADSVILSNLDRTQPQPFLENIDDKIIQFSLLGLRTLCMGMKILSQEEYDKIDEEYQSALNNLDKDYRLKKLASKIERNLILLGMTAVEDRLQDDVPKTIKDLLQANIKIWMLTGDKLETAENIAKSCELLQEDIQLIRIQTDSKDYVEKEITAAQNDVKKCQKNFKQFSISIDGKTLETVLEKTNFKNSFFEIALQANSVIVARATPRQKAEVIRLTKSKRKNISTLAIGDGANDVNMIQEADIGIGIYGLEGTRAVQASDFGIGEFKILRRLLLYQGRLQYIRIGEMILYFFYKNIVFTLPQFYFSFYSAYSAISVFDDWFLSTYNLIFTALPVCVRCGIDIDIPIKVPHSFWNRWKIQKSIRELEKETYLSLFPENTQNTASSNLWLHKRENISKYYQNLYYIGQQNQVFNPYTFIFWVFLGFSHAALVTFFNIYAFSGSINTNGENKDFWSTSNSIFTSVLLVVNVHICFFTKRFVNLTFVGIVICSWGMLILYMIISDNLSIINFWKTNGTMVSSPLFWLTQLCVVGVVFASDLVYIILKQDIFPQVSDYFGLLVKNNLDENEEFFSNLSEKKNEKFSITDSAKYVSSQTTIKNSLFEITQTNPHLLYGPKHDEPKNHQHSDQSKSLQIIINERKRPTNIFINVGRIDHENHVSGNDKRNSFGFDCAGDQSSIPEENKVLNQTTRNKKSVFVNID